MYTHIYMYSFSSFIFPDATYRIFLLFLPWLPCHLYLVVIKQQKQLSQSEHRQIEWQMNFISLTNKTTLQTIIVFCTLNIISVINLLPKRVSQMYQTICHHYEFEIYICMIVVLLFKLIYVLQIKHVNFTWITC